MQQLLTELTNLLNDARPGLDGTTQFLISQISANVENGNVIVASINPSDMNGLRCISSIRLLRNSIGVVIQVISRATTADAKNKNRRSVGSKDVRITGVLYIAILDIVLRPTTALGTILLK